jgi:hypothetical protein
MQFAISQAELSLVFISLSAWVGFDYPYVVLLVLFAGFAAWLSVQADSFRPITVRGQYHPRPKARAGG